MTMAFDLALIDRALYQAVCDAEDALAERHQSYAGYPTVGKFALYEEAVRDARSALDEFAMLRKAIEDAPVATLVYGQSDMLAVVSAENADDWAGKTVRLLVENDDGRG